MKKIIFIHLLNDYSGSPKVLSQVITACQRKGAEIELYSGQSENGFLSNLCNKHYIYFYKRFENRYFTLITFFLSQIILFIKLLKYKNQDVILYINTLLPFGAGLAGLYLSKPVYYHIHEISLKPALFKKFLRFIVSLTAAKVIFVSKFVANAEAFMSKQQYVVENALPDEFLKLAKRHQYQWRCDSRFNVLMICSLKKYKGIIEFIELARYLESHADIHFIMVINASKIEIEEFVSNIAQPKNLTLISRQTDLSPYYQKASLLLNLSRIDEWVETFGLTIIEALAYGIPVIVPPVGGPTEIVADGIEGYLMSSYQLDRIAKCISTLSVDEAKCLELSKNARVRADSFSQANFERKIIRVIYE